MAGILREKMKRKNNNAEQLIKLLFQNAARERTMYHYYTIMDVCLNELEEEGIKEIVEAVHIKSKKHFEALVERIYKLGGSFPFSIKEMDDLPACLPGLLARDYINEHEVLRMMIEGGRCAVRSYTRICNMTAGRDHDTYILSLGILSEELKHKNKFYHFLSNRLPRPLHHSQRPLLFS